MKKFNLFLSYLNIINPFVFLPLCLCAFVALCLDTLFCFADIQLNTPGSIVIITKDELGNSVKGAKVIFTLPGKDGMLNKGADILVSNIDGKQDDDLKFLGEKDSTDGDIELNLPTIKAYELMDNQEFNINVFADGFVNYATITKYLTSKINIIESKNQFNLKIVDSNYATETYKPFSIEISEKLDSFNVIPAKEKTISSAIPAKAGIQPSSVIPAKAGIYKIEDGDELDGDKEVNGVIYFSLTIAESKDKKFNIVLKSNDGKVIKKFQNFIIDGIRQSILKF